MSISRVVSVPAAKASIKNPFRKSDKHIDNLPGNSQLIIFNHLRLQELINCRLVSKKWKALVDTIKFKDLILVIKNSNDREIDDEWYHSRLSKDLLNDTVFTLQPSTGVKLNLIRKHLKMPKFSELKRLQLIFTEFYDAGLKHENALCDFIMKNLQKQFPLLEQLEMEFDDITLPACSEIRHKNLKVLYMNDFEEDDVDLTISCPSLEVFYWGGRISQLKMIIFKHRNVLRWLGTTLDQTSKERKFSSELSLMFKNIVTFDFNGFVENFDPNDVINFKKLRELRFSKSLDFIGEYDEEDYQESYEQFVDNIAYVLNKRPDINFYLQNVKMNEAELRSELQKFKDENVERRKANGW